MDEEAAKFDESETSVSVTHLDNLLSSNPIHNRLIRTSLSTRFNVVLPSK